MSRARQLDRLLRPKSVAIVGASEKPSALGASVLANLEREGYGGAIHLVNPKRSTIAGRPCVATVDDLPEGVDVAILAIPRAAVLATVISLARRKVGAAIVFSAGFAESGAAGLAEQRELGRIAETADMIIEGPNCLGAINFVDGIPLTFVELPVKRLNGRPGIGIVSQSGAMAAVLGVTLLSRDLGLSYSISTGNEAGTGVEDYVDHLVDDPDTRVIAMIVEQFRKPALFLAAAERARAAGKPIVLLHPGSSSAGRESAATHTGALAGDHKVMVSKVDRAGVIRAQTLEELGDITELLLRCPGPFTQGTAVLTESGAFKALTLDLAEQIGLTLPAIGDLDSPLLRSALPDIVPVSNPLDVTAQALVDPDLYCRTLAALLKDDRFGVVLLGLIMTDEKTARLKLEPIVAAIEAFRPNKALIFAGLDEGAFVESRFIQKLRTLGVPYFASAERVMRALARIERWRAEDRSSDGSTPLTISGLPTGNCTVPEYRAKELLATIGIPFPAGQVVRTVAEAREAAGALGYPVVIKAQSSELSHKTEAGGVVLGLGDETELTQGWMRLHANLARHRPGLALDGVLVERMGVAGRELIVGGRNDPEWGPILLVGMGGVQAELLQDVVLLAPDLPEEAIIGHLYALKSGALLRGFRGSPPLDVQAAAKIIAKLGRLLIGEPSIKEIDLNPVVIYPHNGGATVLDALILIGAQESSFQTRGQDPEESG